MRRMILPLMLLVVVPCQPQASPLSEADVAAIRAIPAAMDSAALAHDWDTALALFTEDGITMNPDYPTLEGRAVMRAALDVAFTRIRVTKHSIAFDEVTGSGDIAYVRGTSDEAYVAEGIDEPIVARARFLCVLRKQSDGAWRIAVWAQLPQFVEPPE